MQLFCLTSSICGTLCEVKLSAIQDMSDVEVGEKSKGTLCDAY